MQSKGRELQTKLKWKAHSSRWWLTEEDGWLSLRRGAWEVLIPHAHFYFIYTSTKTDHSQGPIAKQRHRTAGQTVSGFADLA